MPQLNTIAAPGPLHSIGGKPMLERMVIGFAAWTLLCNLVVLTGGNLFCLVAALASTLLATAPLLVLQWWKGRSRRVRSRAARRDLPNEAAWLLSLGLATVLTLILHRPDADDAFYVNLAVGAVDNPWLPLLCRDTMHHLADAPILLPFYRVHSIELLAALFTCLTRVPAIVFLHVFLPPLAAFATLLAYRGLFRRFTPRFWGWASLATCLFLCANGDAHASYGNLSWVRLHQGKGILVTCMIPVIIEATLQYATNPSPGCFLYLAASQIAAVGMSGSSLFIGPMMSLLTAAAGLSALDAAVQQKLKILRGVLAASCYPLVVAGFVLLRSRPSADALAPIGPGSIADNIHYVFGSGPFAHACVVILVCAACLARHPVARRLGAVCSGFALLIVSNPMVAPFLAERFSMGAIFWRFYWLVPLPLFAGLACCIPLERCHVRPPRWTGFAVYAGVILLLLAVLPRQRIFDQSNHTTIGRPGLKVPPFYPDLVKLAAHFHARDSVLMPVELSPWLTTIHDAPRPVLSRLSYVYLYPAGLRETLCAAQLYLSEAGPPRGSSAAFSSLLQTLDVQGVCFPGHLEHAADIVAILERGGYRRVDRPGSATYELFENTLVESRFIRKSVKIKPEP